jgi:hypothetical protein
MRHGLTPSSWGQRPWRRDRGSPRRKAVGPQAHHRDTPPEDVHRVEAGLLARGSSLPSAFPGILPVALIDVGSPLTVAGAAPALSRSHDRSAPASLLAPGRNGPEDLDPQTMGAGPPFVNRNIKTSLYRYIFRGARSFWPQAQRRSHAAPLFEARACRRGWRRMKALFRSVVDHAGLVTTRMTRVGAHTAKATSTTPLDSSMHLDTASDDRILLVDWDLPGTGMRTLETR